MATRTPDDDRVFSLDLPPAAPGEATGMLRRLYHASVPSLERLLGLNRLNEVYDAAAAGASGPTDFIERCLAEMDIQLRVSAADLDRIPKTGPLVVVSNHPFGAVDGFMLVLALARVRPDVRIMGNYMLQRVPQLRDLFIFVDPFGGEDATASNLRPMRQSLRHLKAGGVLAAFPAGEVAHLSLRQRQVTDPRWNPTIARLVRHAKAPVLPVYFDGHNGKLFQLLGLVHPRLRTAMLPRALMGKEGAAVEMRIGNVVPHRKLAALETDEALLGYVRGRTYLLQHRAAPLPAARPAQAPAGPEPIIPPVDSRLMSAEVASLPAGQLLVEHDDCAVYHATATQVPHVLRELGRLREITFRATGEGTGKAIDVDAFDQDYIHLFIWHRAKQEVVGAYRLGPSDAILPRKGRAGLYTSTLFDYKAELLEQLGPALEMGRSFVRAEYQRSFFPLLTLWKGIGRFVVAHPRYKMLFGPVSISNEYQSVSRQLMVQFLRLHHRLSGLAGLVRPRNPFPVSRVRGLDDKSVASMDPQSESLSDLVADLEPDQKGIPILLKHYLRLGAKLLAFNLDAQFGDVVDGLIVVDLTRTDPKLLDKYLGKDGRERFMAYHALRAPRLPVT